MTVHAVDVQEVGGGGDPRDVVGEMGEVGREDRGGNFHGCRLAMRCAVPHNGPTQCCHEEARAMPLFIIEREFADKLNLTDDGVREIEQINDTVGVRVDLLVPQRRPEEDLLPLRGTDRGTDPRSGAARERARERGHRGHPRLRRGPYSSVIAARATG